MIPRDIEPITDKHQSVYKRIGPPEQPRVDQRDVVEAVSSYSPAECARIWAITVATARGTNPPAVVPVVDESGWEAA